MGFMLAPHPGFLRVGLPATCAATGPALLASIHAATDGRWAFPSDRWHDLATWLGFPAAAHPVLVAGWCATGGAVLGLAARAAGEVAVGLGVRPLVAVAAAAALAINGASIRLAFESPRAGIATAALLWMAAGWLERWPVRRRAGPARARAPGRRDFPAVVILAAWGWLLLPGAIDSAGRIAAMTVPVMTAPAGSRPAPADSGLPGIPGWRIADALDVADGPAERSHAYRISGDAVLIARAMPDPAVRRITRDDGRETGFAEAFTLRARPESAVVLVARLEAGGGGRIRVRWNGVPLPSVRLAANPEAFQTIVIGEDRGQLVGAANRVVVERLDGARIVSFGYALIQPAR